MHLVRGRSLGARRTFSIIEKHSLGPVSALYYQRHVHVHFRGSGRRTPTTFEIGPIIHMVAFRIEVGSPTLFGLSSRKGFHDFWGTIPSKEVIQAASRSEGKDIWIRMERIWNYGLTKIDFT